jgi:hypothetical protein
MAHQIWKDGMKRGMAYVEGWEKAAQVLTMMGRCAELTRKTQLSEATLSGAMAVYTDPKGKAFAWQIPFPVAEWERVEALLQ